MLQSKLLKLRSHLLGQFIDLPIDGKAKRQNKMEILEQNCYVCQAMKHPAWGYEGSCNNHIHPDNCTLEDIKVCSELAREVLPPFTKDLGESVGPHRIPPVIYGQQ